MFKIKALETGWATSEWNPVNFEGVILQYQPRIYKFIYRLVREGPLAQDLTQDTFLRAYVALCKEAAKASQAAAMEDNSNRLEAEPSAEPSIIAWLYIIARNAAISELRRRKTLQISSFWLSDDTGLEYEVSPPSRTGLIGNGSDIENHFVLRDELEQAIAKVGRLRLTPLLLYLDGYSYQEISTLTSTSLSGVKTQIFRAKQDLRRSILNQPEFARQQMLA